ncbi:MAG TPA: pyrroline-5-carboxylate reductase dimerization domain-containing protein [Tabrizicola sp.]|nr:pyrroline-5-carboxylate reductase dimerization domain-containing protein [Tabrizicola sp.]
MRLGLIGATGWLGSALGTRLLQSGWPEGDLVLLNRSASRAIYDPWPGVYWSQNAAELCARSEVIVLSIRPEDFPLAGFNGANRLVLSFMTAWSLDRLGAACPGARVVRAMPNGAASGGNSFTPWVAGPGFSRTDVAVTRHLLSAIGVEAAVAGEQQLDYLTALSGSGSAYPALMAQAMIADSLAHGLSEDLARAAVASILQAGGALATEVAHLDAVLDTYEGYRGVTAAGIQAARTAGFQQVIAAALAAAEAKARDLTAAGLRTGTR